MNDIISYIFESAFWMYLVAGACLVAPFGLFEENMKEWVKILLVLIGGLLAYGAYNIAHHNSIQNCIQEIVKAQEKDTQYLIGASYTNQLHYYTIRAICENR